MFYLIRVIDTSLKGAPFRNFVIFSRDLPSAVSFANRSFGSACVASVEPVDTLTFLPRDAEYMKV